MFWHFDYHKAGFTDEDWDQVPRRDKVLIRDYHLNGGDLDQTLLYCEYDTDRQVRVLEHRYRLKSRPTVHVSFVDLNLP